MTKTSRLTLAVLLAIAATWAGCSKSQTDDPIGSLSRNPLFHVKGRIDGAAFSWEAGKEGCYMFTFTEELPGGLFAAGGRMEIQGCPQGCGPALDILLLDTVPYTSENQDTRIWSASGKLLFQGSVAEDDRLATVRTQQLSQSIYGGIIHRWQFGPGCISTASEPDYDFFPVSGSVAASLEIEDAAGNRAFVTKLLDAGHPADCRLRLLVTDCPAEPGKALLYIDDPAGLADTYLWQDGQTVSERCVEPLAGNMYCVTVNVGTPCETRLCTQVKTSISGSLSYCTADFGYAITSAAFDRTAAWPRVLIRYRDDAGAWSDTDSMDQMAFCGAAELISVEPFIQDYRGGYTRKVRMRLNATLKGISGGEHALEDVELVFALGALTAGK